MRRRGRIVRMPRIDLSMRTVMLMLVRMRMFVRVNVRMAVHHVAVRMLVVVHVLVRMDVFMAVRLDRLVDG